MDTQRPTRQSLPYLDLADTYTAQLTRVPQASLGPTDGCIPQPMGHSQTGLDFVDFCTAQTTGRGQTDSSPVQPNGIRSEIVDLITNSADNEIMSEFDIDDYRSCHSSCCVVSYGGLW